MRLLIVAALLALVTDALHTTAVYFKAETSWNYEVCSHALLKL